MDKREFEQQTLSKEGFKDFYALDKILKVRLCGRFMMENENFYSVKPGELWYKTMFLGRKVYNTTGDILIVGKGYMDVKSVSYTTAEFLYRFPDYELSDDYKVYCRPFVTLTFVDGHDLDWVFGTNEELRDWLETTGILSLLCDCDKFFLNDKAN